MAGPKRDAKTNTKPEAKPAEESGAVAEAQQSQPSFAEHAKQTLTTIAENLGLPAEVALADPPPPSPRIGLSLPFGDVDPKLFYKRHVDLQLNARQARTLARIQKAVRGTPYELAADDSGFDPDGRIIEGPAKVIYWLLNGATLLIDRIDAERRGAQSSGDSETGEVRAV